MGGTTWSTPKPNQQLLSQMRVAELRAANRAQERETLTKLGQRIREVFSGSALPLLVVQSHFSLLEGTASPAQWGIVLEALHGHTRATVDRRGGNHPGDAAAVILAERALLAARRKLPFPPAEAQPEAREALEAAIGPWAVLADRGDLMGLPAAREAWGAGRVGIGAVLARGAAEVVLLAPTPAAYRGLCRLLTAQHHNPGSAWNPDPASGLIALVRDEAAGYALADSGCEVYWRAGLRPETRPVPFPIAAAPLLAHLDADRQARPVLDAILARGTVSATPTTTAALADLAGMPERYRGWEDQLERGAALQARCTYDPALAADGSQALHLPPLPPELAGTDANTQLRRLAEAGIPERYGAHPPAALRERLEHELAIIAAKRFAPYILTVWSIAKGHRTCGRGSAASSVVVYLLRITNVDPLRYNLFFERFLAPERTDPPDIDVDFPWDERDDLFAEILDRFGTGRVGIVATHQHLHAEGALREAARAFGLPDSVISPMMTRLHDRTRYGVDQDDDQGQDIPDPWPQILATAKTLIGVPRHVGVHCGGVVITETPLHELVPIHPAAKRIPDPSGPAGATRPMPCLAWEKEGAEAFGLVKIDLLGNRSLAVVRDCLADLAEDGVTIDERRWDPAADPATKRLLASGNTLGCFYIESPATRQLQAKIGSGDFDRLVIHSSIIRPAGNAFVSTYIARHHRWMACDGKITPEEYAEWYPHPALATLLSESYGVLSYQEDVMQVSQAMAGFGSAEANQLRKALGRSDTAERLQQLAAKFDTGCRERGVAPPVIDLVWRMISSFAGYSFAKAHSASFAMVSVQCVWLKAHHPATFLARVIANEGGFYQTSAYVEEARRLGVTIMGPCVRRSQWPTRREGSGAMRIGFHLVKRLSRATADRLIAARVASDFIGLFDLVHRTQPGQDELQALHEAGAFDELLKDRSAAQRAWLLAKASRLEVAVTAPSDQATLTFESDLVADPGPPALPASDPQLSQRRRFSRLGMLPTAHPMALWPMPSRPPLRAQDLTPRSRKSTVTLVGWPITRKDVQAVYDHDRNGQPLDQIRIEDMAFVTLEDETGLIETTWFPDAYGAHAVLLSRGEPLLVSGTVEVDYGVISVAVRWVKSIG